MAVTAPLSGRMLLLFPSTLNSFKRWKSTSKRTTSENRAEQQFPLKLLNLFYFILEVNWFVPQNYLKNEQFDTKYFVENHFTNCKLVCKLLFFMFLKVK